MLLDDSGDALDLVVVTVDGTLDLLWVVQSKPGTLAEVRALTRDLEVQPLSSMSVYVPMTVISYSAYHWLSSYF